MRLEFGVALCALVVGLSWGQPSYATGIPVIDVANLEQQVITTVEEVSQTLKQIEEYALQLSQFETQLQQYQNMILNTTGLATVGRIWNQATAVMDKINALTNVLDGQKARLGSLDRFIERFKDPSQWASASCVGSGGCTPAQRDEVVIHWNDNTKSVYDANTALIRSGDEQASSIKADAQKLEELQTALHGAQGQVASIQASGQIAAAQTDQIIKLRAQLVAQANAQAIKDQAVMDRQAATDAADRAKLGGSYTHDAPRTWTFSSPGVQ